MLVKILGAIDLVAGIILILFLKSTPAQFLMILGILLLAKSALGLLKSFASWIDFLAGIFLLITMVANVPSFLAIIVGILIIQKGIISFV